MGEPIGIVDFQQNTFESLLAGVTEQNAREGEWVTCAGLASHPGGVLSSEKGEYKVNCCTP